MSPFTGLGQKPLKLAMIGMVDGNGHPYSWSAIFNGYDRDAMADCPYATIPNYLGKQPPETLGVENARVTHVWCDDPADAPKVARASLIENVLERPEDAIGQVDAAIIATDIGSEHVERARPFVEAGVPLFIDKPLTDNAPDLAVFRRWIADEGRPILSSSALLYSKELMPWRHSTAELGSLRHVCITTAKSWERYGIHALSSIFPIVGPGFESVRNTGSRERAVVHLKHRDGVDVTVAAIDDMKGGFGKLQMCGTEGTVQAASADTYYAFRAQLLAFVSYLRTGERPFPFSHTEELMRIVIGGIVSRDEGGREVCIDEVG